MVNTRTAHTEHDMRRRLARLAGCYQALVVVIFALIVLGALVRANDAGLACPDWPLCFGELVPAMDVKVGFEWSHRALAGLVTLAFLALAARTWRMVRYRLHVVVVSALLLLQILLGALTVWELLAEWTVTSHLLAGNAVNVSILLLALRLRRAAKETGRACAPESVAPRPALRLLVLAGAAALLTALQVTLGGLVSSSYSGLACPEWPTCSGGLWFPAWSGSVGLHLLHRTGGYLLVLALAALVLCTRGLSPAAQGARRALLGAGCLGLGALGAGIANVLLAIPVEITALHSALAAALVLALTFACHEAFVLYRNATHARGENT